ncbi:MAG: hopanoid biosynthesis-associated protein HpnK [Deltaproteobacteria bacterium]|nr:hopanoid biosynthesis-associated protein HpnK [Deltaproteobacteria bacterium]
MKRVIVTADDFGRCPAVNQAVIQAHQKGILKCASLMVNADATDEAIALARAHSSLKVGLHLVLVDGFAVLPKKEIPDLVDETQRFSDRPASSGLRYFLSKRIKRQLVQECKAQIEKFLDSGLKMDHLNSHHHLHIHPSVANIVVALAVQYHIPAVRLPWQGLRTLTWKNFVMAAVMLPWVIRLRHKLQQAGIAHNREIFGLYETGAMLEETWLRLIPMIKPGVTEIFCHPAVTKSTHHQKSTHTHYHVEEFEALLSLKVKDRLMRAKVALTSFSDIAGGLFPGPSAGSSGDKGCN